MAKRAQQINFEHLTGVSLMRAFGCSRQTLYDWQLAGLPRNQDGSYSLPAAIKWRVQRETAKAETVETLDLKDRKLEKDIEWKSAQIEKLKENYIERSLHETIMVSRAATLRTFLEKTAMANAVHLAGRSVDEVRTQLYRLMQQAMEAYVGGSSEGGK